jgi:hypothetical protein
VLSSFIILHYNPFHIHTTGVCLQNQILYDLHLFYAYPCFKYFFFSILFSQPTQTYHFPSVTYIEVLILTHYSIYIFHYFKLLNKMHFFPNVHILKTWICSVLSQNLLYLSLFFMKLHFCSLSLTYFLYLVSGFITLCSEPI